MIHKRFWVSHDANSCDLLIHFYGLHGVSKRKIEVKINIPMCHWGKLLNHYSKKTTDCTHQRIWYRTDTCGKHIKSSNVTTTTCCARCLAVPLLMMYIANVFDNVNDISIIVLFMITSINKPRSDPHENMKWETPAQSPINRRNTRIHRWHVYCKSKSHPNLQITGVTALHH